jgi:3-isopropylmalate dehydrogenase
MSYRVATICGDGIGPEVIEEGKKVIDAASEEENFEIEWVPYPHGAEHYLKTGELISEDTLKEFGKYKAIYLGALGDPRVETGVLEREILLKLRFHLDQYINLRPVRLMEGVSTPLKDKDHNDIDFIVVRENTEDFYIGMGGMAKRGDNKNTLEMIREMYEVKFGLNVQTNAEEIAYQIGIISREGASRAIKYAFELARRKSRRKVTCVDKANVLQMYKFWREIFEETANEYEDIDSEFNFVDATCMWMIKNPESYEVIVTPNIFGDIITDLGAMIQGGLGMAPGGNINPDGTSMFEPIHGSSPKYRGKNVANPIAAILAGSMLLEELGEDGAAERIEMGVCEVLKERRIRTYDLGGSSKTTEVGDAIAEKVGSICML